MTWRALILMETLRFAQVVSNFKTHQTRMRFQILFQDEAVPSYLLWHMCVTKSEIGRYCIQENFENLAGWKAL